MLLIIDAHCGQLTAESNAVGSAAASSAEILEPRTTLPSMIAFFIVCLWSGLRPLNGFGSDSPKLRV